MGSITMITHHKRLQHYNRHYCSACVAGTFGCRWHRYQQSKDPTSKWDRCWFLLLFVVFLYMCAWLYFWLVVGDNDYDFINWEVSSEFDHQYEWYTVILALTCTAFAYISLLMLLAVLHLSVGYELYMHYVHKCLVFLTAAGCVTATIIVNNVYSQGWSLAFLSLQVYGPFLQIGAVAVMTVVSWVIARQWLWIYKKVGRVLWMVVFVSFMLCLYLSPLLVDSPCITDDPLPTAPILQAHRGASAIFPENTLLAFNYAAESPEVFSLEADIKVSFDGVPFAMHDYTLKRTTNVKHMFPEVAGEPAANFNISQLRQLDAGSWFLEDDPHGTTSKLSREQKDKIHNTSIPTLEEVLAVAKDKNKSLMLKLTEQPSSHPYANTYTQVIVDTILQSGINTKQILWDYNDMQNSTQEFTAVATEPWLPSNLVQKQVNIVYLDYEHIDTNDIRAWQSAGISVWTYPVNAKWLYSLAWCEGINLTGTDYAHYFPTMSDPLWKWSEEKYLIVWVTVDIVSAFLIATIFVIQWFRHRGQIFNPETVFLQAAQQRVTHMRQQRTMKEKLIHAAEGLQDTDPGIVGVQIAETPVSEVDVVITDANNLDPNNPEMFVRSGSTTSSIHSVNDIKLKEINAIAT